MSIALAAFGAYCVWLLFELRVMMLAVAPLGALTFAGVAFGLTLVAVARGLAHEINNPLAFVTSNVRHVHLELAEKGGLERIRKVVAELQSVTRGTAAERAADVRKALEASAWLLRHAIASRAALEVELEEVPGTAISGAELSMALTQLITALVDPLPEHPRQPPVLRLRTAREGMLAKVEVVVPAAIPAAPLAALVDLRADTPLDDGLHGVGLARQILEREGAQIRIDPAGKGDVVLGVTLPAPDSPAENE
ncbi:MAG: hypothetical protein IRZ16_19525 [Myxococcaceae bacterium]|nr:hypothetical protein [Myxococcaceae bacterium]